MSKLHLIKPWRLRTVRQRLENVRDHGSQLLMIIPAKGPEEGEYAPRGSTDGRSDYRKKAPVSDAIFASATTTNIR